MRTLFAHDHKFVRYENDYYTTGTLNDDLWSRYTKKFGKINVIARVIDENHMDNGWAKISNKDVNINNVNESNISVRDLVIEADMIICRLPSIVGLIALIYAKVHKKPYFVEMVGDPWTSLWFYGSIKGKIFAPIMSIITKIAVRYSEYVIYVSQQYLQNRYPTKGFSVGCPDVILNTPQLSSLNKRLTKLSVEKDYVTLGLIGSLDVEYRGHDTVIKAMEELEKRGINCKVKFLGNGQKKRIVNISQKHNQEANVIFSGRLPSGEPVLEWIDEIDILTMPTQAETLGRSIIEAMSRGCPVIGSIETAIGEQIGSDCLIKAKDYKALADLIQRMVTDKDYISSCMNENFYRSFKYDNSQTNRTRNDFYNMFLSETRLNNKF